MNEYGKRSRLDWTEDEDEILEEAIRKCGTRWTRIEKEYGLDGNGKLAHRVGNNRLAGRARTIAIQRTQDNIDLGVFSDVTIKLPPVNQDVIAERSAPLKWTDELDSALLESYEQHGVNWSDIRDSSQLLKPFYRGTSYRDRLVSLQHKAMTSNDEVPTVLNAPIPGKEYLYYRLLAPDGKCLSITCPGCSRVIGEQHLLQEGLNCVCECDIRELAKATRKFKWVTYIIVKLTSIFPREIPSLEDSLKKEISKESPEYIGVTDNLHTRLLSHVCKWVDPSKHRVHVSLRLGERIAIKLFTPKKNDEGDRSKDDSHMIRINTSNGKIQSFDISQSIPRTFSALTDPPDNNSFPCRTKDFETVLYTAGIIAGASHPEGFQENERNTCFRLGKEKCECPQSCTFRATINDLKKIVRWYPLLDSDVNPGSKPHSAANIPLNLDYSLGNIDTDTLSEFCLKVVVRNRDIQEKTKENYIENVKVLLNYKFIDNIWSMAKFIANIESYYTVKTTNSYLSLMSVFLKNLTKYERKTLFSSLWYYAHQTFLLHYRFYMLKLSKLNQINKKSKRDDANWINLPDLIKILDDLRPIIMNKRPPKMSEVQPYIALLLHLKQAAIRNDYHSIMLFDYNINDDNFLDWDNKVFVFNHFKNAKSLGQVTIPVKDDVLQDLRFLVEYRKSKNCQFLFTNLKNGMMTDDTFSSMLSRFTFKHTGKRIASTLIRKIVVSHFRKDEPSNKDSVQLAHDMMHTEETSRTIYRKID